MSGKPKFKWSYVLLCVVVGAVLGVLASLLFGFIGTPWQAALTLSLIGLVVGLVQPALNNLARRSLGPKE
ncbi:hypothetical protein ABZ508_18135 [Streptomyces lavendulocolor]|uniref:Uncharacterized protein n=1 Tax=Streptomyces lavendulocolor TaxID=67316 RepID=A0ABV2W7T8_9ACTN